MLVFGFSHIIDSDPLLNLSVDVRNASFMLELLLFYLLPISIAA